MSQCHTAKPIQSTPGVLADTRTVNGDAFPKERDDAPFYVIPGLPVPGSTKWRSVP